MPSLYDIYLILTVYFALKTELKMGKFDHHDFMCIPGSSWLLEKYRTARQLTRQQSYPILHQTHKRGQTYFHDCPLPIFDENSNILKPSSIPSFQWVAHAPHASSISVIDPDLRVNIWKSSSTLKITLSLNPVTFQTQLWVWLL